MAKGKKRKESPIRKLMKPQKVAIPIVIGVLAAAFMVYRGWDAKAFNNINWNTSTYLFLLIAFIMVALRDFGYMVRLRILTDKKISWRNAFDIIMLWEFSSAVTPSVVGGSGVAIFILNKEGLSVGRSTAVVMTTAFLDELFYVLMVPMLLLVVGTETLFPVELQKEFFGITLGTQDIFWVGYGFIILLISLILFGIFISPIKFKMLLVNVFKLPFLKRWAKAAHETGDEVITTSKELRGKPISFWLKSFVATFLSWTARYWVTNFLLLAFATGIISVNDHMLIYARQLVMWVIMLISPTPGSAGVAELAFEQFLKDFTPVGLAVALGLLWRLFTYYPYLFLGAIVLPGWIQRVYLGRKLIKFKDPES